MFKSNPLLLLLLSYSLLLACSPGQKKVIQVNAVNSSEAQAIRKSLLTGSAVTLPEQAAGTTSQECQDFLKQLPPSIVRGYVTVPENWDDPHGRQIQVFYYGRISGSEKHSPVVFFNGGPSADSHSSYSVLETVPSAGKMPFIYIDQRGNGCSDSYPEDLTAETAERLSHYTTRAIVLDAEEVRKKLFGPASKWHVFGQSYGGMIVQRYLTLAPESIEAAHAHGYSVMSDAKEWLKLRILSQKRVAEDFFTQYPADRAKILAVRAQIPASTCFTDADTTVCGPAVLDAATILLGFKSSWGTLHHWIEAISANGTLNEGTLKNFIRIYVFGVYAHNLFPGSVISRVEMNLGAADSEMCGEVSRRLNAQGENPESWPINECRLLQEVKNPRIDPLVAGVKSVDALTLDAINNSLQKNPSLPFFLYSGQKDVFVPVETFAEEASRLGNRMTYRSFAASGHEGFYTEQQVWNDLLMAIPGNLL